MRRIVRIAALLTLAVPFSATAGGTVDAAEIRALREQIRMLDARLRALEERAALQSEAASPPAPAPEPGQAGRAAGFAVSAADSPAQLRLRANIQADGRFFAGDRGPAHDTFLIRRLVLNFEGRVADELTFRLMPDFAGHGTTLLEAYAAYQRSPALNLLAGKTKSPFDLERLVSQTDLLFIERSYPTSLSPNRDIGLQVFGAFAGDGLTYQLAWLNGARDNDSTVVDFESAKDVVARVFAHPFRHARGSALQGLGLGVAVSAGGRRGSTPAPYRTTAQQTFFSWRPGVVNDGRHTRVEPQAYLYAGPFGLIGSWVRSKQALAPDAGAPPHEIGNTAWYAAAHWVLTGEDAGYRAVSPAAAFNWQKGTWGALELAARYGELAIDRGAFPRFANPAVSARRARSTTVGLNWHLTRNVKATVNLEHTDLAGPPDGGGQETEKALLSRVQLRY
jgi:phosphate-selective porin OprO and OprP